MKTFILLTLLTATAGAATPIEKCNSNLLPFSYAPQGYAANTPQRGCLFSLAVMSVFQKIDGGYLIIPPSEEQMESKPSILVTSEEYQQGEQLSEDRQAFYIGERQYKTTLGFTVTAHLFQEVLLKATVKP